MYRILVLTDHTGHTDKNSLYAFCKAIANDALVESVDVGTRGIEANHDFYFKKKKTKLYVTPVTPAFEFHENGEAFQTVRKSDAVNYDVILVRLPPPISHEFLKKLKHILPEKRIINSPTGIGLTGNKKFLLEVGDLCAPTRLLESKKDLRKMLEEFPIVLKPLNTYGGKGVVRLKDGTASGDNIDMPAEEFIANLDKEFFPVLGMKYLKNVNLGDKRTIVVNGHIIGSSLRVPGEGSWMCNVAQGGTSRLDAPDKDELAMAKTLTRRLKKLGVIIFGFDTLVNDDGKRVLSELNATSVGGLVHMERDDSQDVLDSIIQFLLDYIDLEVYGE